MHTRVHMFGEAGAIGRAVAAVEGGGEEPGWHLRCPRSGWRKIPPPRPTSADLDLHVSGSRSNGTSASADRVPFYTPRSTLPEPPHSFLTEQAAILHTSI